MVSENLSRGEGEIKIGALGNYADEEFHCYLMGPDFVFADPRLA